MRRVIYTYSTLAVILLWFVLSYVADRAAFWPTAATVGPQFGAIFQWILLGGLFLFVAIQLWLLVATMRMFKQNDDGTSSPQAFGLARSSEFFWTAVPLLMTVGLALVSYQTWLSLTSP